jgi:hypothetical protein
MKLTGFQVVAPSTVAVNEEFSVGIKALCAPHFIGAGCYGAPPPSLRSPYNASPRGITYMDNVPREWDGSVMIRAEGGYRGPDGLSFKGRPGPYRNDKRPITRLGGLRFTAPGIKRIEVADPASGARGVSNPVEVSAEPLAERLFWGDIHSQTFFSDGLRCPEELYAFARHEAFLDIFGLADHSESLTNRQWEYFVGVTNDCNEHGAFVTLVGLEWTSRRFGHRNLHFPGDKAPCLRCNDPVAADLEHVYRVARKEGALVVPHHSANATMGVDWSLGHDPEVERLVEIHSIWGNSERPASAGNPRPIRMTGGEKAGQHVLDALRLGRRYGFTGGGDIHDGRPGDELHVFQKQPPHYKDLWRQGIMGVWAKGLTREAIFEALWNRRCFATTNVRTIVRFSVCGQPMGGATSHRGPRPVTLHVASEVPVSKVDIVRNGDDLLSLHPQTCEVDFETVDPGHGLQASRATPADWYYARITREDGEMAWSSPVWVDGKPAPGGPA